MSPVMYDRRRRQDQVVAWGCAAFGFEQMDSQPQRAVRLLEEALEAYQAASCTPEMAHRLVDFVFARPKGDLNKEIGGVGVCLLALAYAAHTTAEGEEVREVERLLLEGPDRFKQRNQDKNDAGFRA